MRFEFTLKSTTAMLMHSDSIDWADELEQWRKDPGNKNKSKAGDDRSPAWTWVGYCYDDGEHIALPSENLQKCLSQAGTRMILKKQKTYKELAVAGLWFESDYLDFTVGGKQVPVKSLVALKGVSDFTEHLNVVRGKLGFDLLSKRVKIGKAKNIRVRPKFESWAVRGIIEVTSKDISPDALRQMFHLAGNVGLGDWRPGGPTPGRFGMFESELKALK